MTVSTLRPNATVLSNGAVTGAASAHAALADNSDSSYVTFDNGESGRFELTDLTLPAAAVMKAFSIRVRSSTAASGTLRVEALPLTGSFPNFFNNVLVNWAAATTITGATSSATGGVTVSDVDGANAQLIWTSAGLPIIVYEVYFDVTYVALPTLTVDAPTGTVTDANQPAVIWTPTIDAGFTLRQTDRTPGDCMRIATALAYGQALGFTYADTPDSAFANGGAQFRAYQNWAAICGLRWWRSFESAPTAGLWLALVDSPGGYASHVVVMNGRRLLADPANHYTPADIGPRTVRGAYVLARADDPWWTSDVEFWRLPEPYRDLHPLDVPPR